MLTINTKICTNYFAPLIGWNEETHKCEKIPNIICFRRGSPNTKDYQKHITKINLGLTSYYDITKEPYCKHIDAWLHCFKNPMDFIKDKNPKILLSESDFLDDNTVLHNKKSKDKNKYDFFYFTMVTEIFDLLTT